MTDAETTAVAALQEATNALHVGQRSPHAKDGIAEESKPTLAGEVANVLDALAALLRTVDHDPLPASSAEHRLHAVTQHIVAGASTARGLTRPQTPRPPAAPSDSRT